MADEAMELFGAPDSSEETTESDNQIVDDVEIEPEEEYSDSHKSWEAAGQEFSRFEHSYRNRRIRELTLAPIKKKRGRSNKATAA